jgi:A/G-specific adenine glycosylase
MNIFEPLSVWYDKNKRPLPWRDTTDPYRIWLSEVILQQTRVDQGMSYYLKFVEHYPTVFDLANASEDQVLKDWQGLGYYSRARNLHFTAKYVATKLKGKFPETYKELLTLKGVGKYTAAAIASFCYGQAVPVVDGNVYRVLSRLFGIETPIDSTDGIKEFQATAEACLDQKDPATYNQAIMEFGALQCTPKTPDCMFCPFQDRCVARASNRIHLLPIKSKKLKQRARFFNYVIVHSNGHVYLNKRTGKDIWQHLHDFPLIETESTIDTPELLAHSDLKVMLGMEKPRLLGKSEAFKHVLSHQIIKAVFWEFEITENRKSLRDFIRIPISDFSQYAVPRLVENYTDAHPRFQ